MNDWPARLFAQIVRPRLPGTPALSEVQAAISGQLEALGYQVARLPFGTSRRRLVGVAVGAAGLGWVAILTAPLLILPVPGWAVTLTGVAALTFTALLAAGIADGRLPLDTPAIRGVNIVASRGAPSCWLVAHCDSKSQAFSLAGRVLGGSIAFLGVVVLVVLLVVRLAGPLPLFLVVVGCMPALVGGAVLSFSQAHDGSSGAVDNATGVIAALIAADLLRVRRDVGVLITDAEEYGLEGADAWAAATNPRGSYFVNFDGLDDRGAYRVMRHSRLGDSSDPRGGSRELAARLAEALRPTGHRVIVGAFPPGVLVDGVVLARSGMVGVTVSRGDWRTLRVVHTRRDDPARLTLASADGAGRAAARAVERFLK